MKSVLSTLRKIDYSVMSYLDDIFICGDTFEECRDAVLATVNLLLKLGFSIHPQKSQLIPVQKIEYLGFLIDSVKMKISLAKLKQDKLNNLIAEISNSSKLRIRDVFKVLCSFETALPAITNRCFYMFYLQNWNMTHENYAKEILMLLWSSLQLLKLSYVGGTNINMLKRHIYWIPKTDNLLRCMSNWLGCCL